MIRVLQVIGKMDRAGAETMIMNLYRNIDRNKIQFDFMVFSSEEADYDKEIISLGGKIYRMPAFKGFNYFKLCHKLKKFFKEHPYKIVHGHIGSLAPAYLHYAKKAGAYTIAHSHGPNSNVWIEKIVYLFFAYWVRYVADFFFACSEQSGIDRFGSKVVNSKQFKVIRNAIDSEQFKYTPERQQMLKKQFGVEQKIVIGHVGRFVVSKNHRFLIEIFKEIINDEPNSVLMFVGRGTEEDDIKKKVREEGLEEKVFFLGIRNDIADMMNLFDVFVFPSMYEGLPVTMVEAQAAGLPCFYSDEISDEVIVTDNMWKLPLEWEAKKWKDDILKTLYQFERENTSSSIVKMGFDIRQTTRELAMFYLAHYNIDRQEV